MRGRVAGVVLVCFCAALVFVPIGISATSDSGADEVAGGVCIPLYAYLSSTTGALFTEGRDRTRIQLVLSPKTAPATRAFAEALDGSTKAYFDQVADLLEHGIELLREAGVTESQLDIIEADQNSATTNDQLDLVRDLEIGGPKLERAVTEFAREKQGVSIDEPPPKISRAIARQARPCLPSTHHIACDELVTDREVRVLTGRVLAVKEVSGQCAFATDDDPLFAAVAVFDTADAYEVFASHGSGRPLTGVVDEAAFATSHGRTQVVARRGNHTVTLDFPARHGRTTPAQIAQVTTNILDRL